jgi:hypothetical protein
VGRPERPNRFTEMELINLLAKILRANGAGRVEGEPLIGSRLRPDLIVHGDSVLLIEVKVVSPQTRTRLFGVVEQLRSYRDGIVRLTGLGCWGATGRCGPACPRGCHAVVVQRSPVSQWRSSAIVCGCTTGSR